MSTLESAPSVVVGIDGSKSATQAALWAIDEAVSRDIPLRLVCVVEPSQADASDSVTIASAAAPRAAGRHHDSAARSALFDAYRAVEATGKPVKIESEILWGRPLTRLLQESRSAVMICVGSMGLNHARFGQGSVAGALAGSSLCPVAVIHRPSGGATTPEVLRVVAEVDNGAVLRHAFEEARLRSIPLRAVAVQAPRAVNSAESENRLAQVQLDRRLGRWTRLYPDVSVDSAIVHGHACRYMADNGARDQLFVTDSHAAQVCSVYSAGSSVLTVRAGNL